MERFFKKGGLFNRVCPFIGVEMAFKMMSWIKRREILF